MDIYDLQLESLCKNLIYQANGNEKLKKIFKIKLKQEQERLWTASCIENINSITMAGHNYWIRDTIILLKKENINICNHEIIGKHQDHKIMGGNIEIISLFPKNLILISAQSRKK
ncbi:hypothetical protein RirG_135430 [Rhizophagus irregularis DAOM 197198w]|uniref:Uncharacterized protein n=1 Tax=Rhizophagus irregularis (strain DAOM 197198w) TaxID=1432141 RepID=A0A015J6Q5_RHIIW|nr:hypothetical protein RirG_135430 [Rhizophagus irregularis DAOM 197198w]